MTKRLSTQMAGNELRAGVVENETRVLKAGVRTGTELTNTRAAHSSQVVQPTHHSSYLVYTRVEFGGSGDSNLFNSTKRFRELVSQLASQ